MSIPLNVIMTADGTPHSHLNRTVASLYHWSATMETWKTVGWTSSTANGGRLELPPSTVLGASVPPALLEGADVVVWREVQGIVCKSRKHLLLEHTGLEKVG